MYMMKRTYPREFSIYSRVFFDFIPVVQVDRASGFLQKSVIY